MRWFKKRIGDYLVEKALIRREWDHKIVQYSQEHHLKFGESAVELGLITPSELRQVLVYPFAKERCVDVSSLSVTASLLEDISLEDCFRHGVFPLGEIRRISTGFQKVKILGALETKSEQVQKWKEQYGNKVRVVPILGDAWLELIQQFLKTKDLGSFQAFIAGKQGHSWFAHYEALSARFEEFFSSHKKAG